MNRYGRFFGRSYFTFIFYDATRTDNVLNISSDYIIHAASNAFPSKIAKEPVESMLCNFIGVKSLLDYAAGQNIKRVLYISSSEIYGKNRDMILFKKMIIGILIS